MDQGSTVINVKNGRINHLYYVRERGISAAQRQPVVVLYTSALTPMLRRTSYGSLYFNTRLAWVFARQRANPTGNGLAVSPRVHGTQPKSAAGSEKIPFLSR